jgi:hypothetical protein
MFARAVSAGTLLTPLVVLSRVAVFLWAADAVASVTPGYCA